MSENKQKTGRIAIPYLLTIFIGLLVVGGLAFELYKYLGIGKEEAPPKPQPRNGIATASYEDSHTLLLILDEPEMECSSTFVLMRSIPRDKKLLFIGIPSNSVAVVNGSQESLKGSYERGGGDAAREFVQTAIGVNIDRYMVFGPDAFKKVCDIFGGVTFGVDVDIVGLQKDVPEQYLNSEQIEKFVTYPLFDDGEFGRAFRTASLLSNMVNQTDTKRIADSFDMNFDTIINMVTKTDVTSVDYGKKKNAIKYMFNYGTSMGLSIVIDGTESGDDFVPSSSFISNLPTEYFAEDRKDA